MTTVDKRRLGTRARVESIDVVVEIREEEGDILEGRKEHVYLTIQQYTNIIYTAQRIAWRMSLRLNKAASVTATEMIII